MTTNDANESEIYHDYSVDDEDQPGAEATLPEDDIEDPLDRGYSPPEKPSAAQGYGNTPWEEAHGETIDQRVDQEVPEEDPYEEAADESSSERVEGMEDPEVGDDRAGRLVDPDRGIGEDTEADLVGEDVGIDGAAASAEEAAVHVVDDEE